MRIVIALGGNALLHRGDPPSARLQEERLAEVAPALARLISTHEVAIVHGNGPQVGVLAIENENDRLLPAPYPLADMVAESQGLIGSWIVRALQNAEAGKDVLALISRTLVDTDDPAFAKPTKFIGSILTEAAARSAAETHGWTIAADAGGWRRVVPSPLPQEILEASRVTSLLDAGAAVVVAGGGGIPVTRTACGLTTVDAVVDKDHAASLLARLLDADLFVILTDVAGVISAFGTDHAELISRISPEQLRSEQFAAGSMGPKVAAACDFVTATGRQAIIASLSDAEAAVTGAAGTRISTTPAPGAR